MDEERYTYWLQFMDQPPFEVTKEEWVRAERRAGFVPKGGGYESKACATGGFGSAEGVKGILTLKGENRCPACYGFERKPACVHCGGSGKVGEKNE